MSACMHSKVSKTIASLCNLTINRQKEKKNDDQITIYKQENDTTGLLMLLSSFTHTKSQQSFKKSESFSLVKYIDRQIKVKSASLCFNNLNNTT